MNTTILTLNGRLDKDTAPMYLKPGDVIMRRNARVAVGSGSDGMVNKPLQDTLFVNRNMPNGVNKTVGWCKYEEYDSVIYFNYNSAGNHGIYKFNVHTRVNTLVLMTGILNFTADTIVDARVLGDELIWVSPGIEPRMISISRAIRFSNRLPVTGVIWQIDPMVKGSIIGTVYELDNEAGKGSINGYVEETLITPDPGTDPTHGAITGTVYVQDKYAQVTGTIIQI